MKSLFDIAVVPSVLKRVTWVLLLILKWVTSAPSAPFRLMTKPEVVWISSLVVASVTDGVSADRKSVVLGMSVALVRRPPDESVEPWTWKLPLANEFAAGVNLKPA